MRISFDFDDLEAFLAVRETGSFHLAAQKLALSQSAITRRVRKLEEALDCTLFDRTTRKVAPTLAARRLEARAQAILEDARETECAMRDESVAFTHQRSLVVTVAILPTTVAGLVPAALGIYRRAGHAARLRLLDEATNGVLDAVTAGAADFGITSMVALDPALSFETLFEDPMVIALATDHPLTAQSRIGWADLRDEEVILPARNTGNRALIDDSLARSGDLLRWTFEVERSATALTLASQGSGIAVLPASAVHAAAQGSVAWRPLDAPDLSRTIGLLTRATPADRQEVAQLKAAFRVAAKAHASIRWKST